MKFIFSLSFLVITASSMAQCEDFVLTFITNAPSCYGFSAGSVTGVTTGGAGGTYYTITDADGVTVNIGGGSTANTLTEGWYFVQAIDEVGCVIEDSTFIEQPGQIAADLIITASNTDPDCNGSAIVDEVYNYSGDFEMISYYWAPNPSGINGIGADTINGFCPGDHTLSINDENGCFEVIDFVIGELANIDESLLSPIQFMANAVTGEITVQQVSSSSQLTIQFYEITGKLIYTTTLNESLTILNPNLGAGTYLYAIVGASSFLSKGKFVVTE